MALFSYSPRLCARVHVCERAPLSFGQLMVSCLSSVVSAASQGAVAILVCVCVCMYFCVFSCVVKRCPRRREALGRLWCPSPHVLVEYKGKVGWERSGL